MKIKRGDTVSLKTNYGTYTGTVSRVSWKTREVWIQSGIGAPIQKISFDDIEGW